MITKRYAPLAALAALALVLTGCDTTDYAPNPEPVTKRVVECQGEDGPNVMALGVELDCTPRLETLAYDDRAISFRLVRRTPEADSVHIVYAYKSEQDTLTYVVPPEQGTVHTALADIPDDVISFALLGMVVYM